MPRASLRSVLPDYDEYHGVHGGISESSMETGADGKSSEELFKESLLWN